ncbi:DUF4129 domain-containing protein [Stenotrophomonas rhizophila]|uniref:DUF4129 domain-containing protein n=1 Tax=Stenotrophomonas rhizophila TaxID=216778 RepID=A0A7V8CFV1_9GAMM|nr:DUF4129 domain-containing protein [Stenotrophomonas rhizophila]KAB7631248.1 DUF4129 domain-containing protein [Stenotrophomonas rhizophila]
MQIDRLNVVLRARSGWEAMELGMALVRRHAAAIWAPWVIVSLPVFVLLNALAWWTDSFGWAWLAMWWLKPLFERIALYVISRGVFGDASTTPQTLRAQRTWGWEGFWGYLGWRRLSPLRSVLLPVNLLEGADPAHRRQRRRAIAGSAMGHAVLLTLVCMVFEIVLVVGGIAAVFLFIPVDLLSESWRAAWELAKQDMPAWMQLGVNLLFWLAATLIGPFYVGAGFGLYLDRRTQMEAWDVEIAFRRLHARLQRAAPLLVLALVLVWPGAALHAQQAPAQSNTKGALPVPADDAPSPAQDADAASDADADGSEDDDADDPPRTYDNDPDNTPPVIFGAEAVDTAGFRQAVQRAYEDPLQSPTREVTEWTRIESDATEAEKAKREAAAKATGQRGSKGPLLPARIAEWTLWAVVGVLVLLLLATAPRWLPWLRGSGQRRRAKAAAVIEEPIRIPDVVPPDPASRARALWQEGRPRQALALLYRASVESMSERAGITLPPGATEAQCLRASRRMPVEADRSLFARIVRIWQYAAYAGRLPSDEDFNALATILQAQFGWRA